MAMAKRASRAEWQRRVEAWRKSRLSADEFTARHHLKLSTFRWWASQFPAHSSHPGFARVVLAPAVSTSRIPSVEVVLTSGRLVRVAQGFDPALLREVVRALEGERR
jgi:hypothetical protein